MRVRPAPAVWLVLSFTSFVSLGCALQAGPINEANFLDRVARTIELGEEPVLLSARASRVNHSPAEWFLLQQNRHRPAPLQRIVGALLLQDTRLLFIKWLPEDETYESSLELRYDDIAAVESERVGTGWRSFRIDTHDGATYYLEINNGIGGLNLVRHDKADAILRERIRWRTLADFAAPTNPE